MNTEKEIARSQRKLLMKVKVMVAQSCAWGDISPKHAFSMLCTAVEKHENWDLNKRFIENVETRIEELKNMDTERAEKEEE